MNKEVQLEFTESRRIWQLQMLNFETGYFLWTEKQKILEKNVSSVSVSVLESLEFCNFEFSCNVAGEPVWRTQ